MKVAFTAQFPLPPESERRLRQALEAGETALWTGRPAPGRVMRRRSSLLTCGALVGLGGLLLEAVCAHNHSPAGMAGAAVLTTLGLWTAAQGARAALQAGRTVYAVTDRRALILDGAGNTLSLTPDQIRDRTLWAGRDGTGDLYFACLDREVTIEDSSRTEHDGFRSIADVHAVDTLLRQTFG